MIIVGIFESRQHGGGGVELKYYLDSNTIMFKLCNYTNRYSQLLKMPTGNWVIASRTTFGQVKHIT